MKKSTILIALLIVAVALFALGCAGRNTNNPTATTAPGTPEVTGTTQATAMAPPMVTPIVTPAATDDSADIDPSLADITNESDESVPDEG